MFRGGPGRQTGEEADLRENWKVNGLIAVLSGAAWVASFVAHNHFMPFLTHAPGIDLVFIPSGVRLIAIMIGGIWAVVGICVGALFLTGPELHTLHPGVILTVSACAGLCPYVALRASMRIVGVETGLGNLAAAHLPFISLGVALGSSVLHNLLFGALGLEPWQAFGDHVLAMATGDFLGILLAMVIVLLFLRVVRKPA